MIKILIIDDEEIARYTLRAILEGAGHDVIEAADGREGVNQFQLMAEQDTPVDIVVSDIIMPVMSGQRVIARIKELDSKIRVIAISGGGGMDPQMCLREAERAGADFVLAKPFQPTELLEIIGECLA